MISLYGYKIVAVQVTAIMDYQLLVGMENLSNELMLPLFAKLHDEDLLECRQISQRWSFFGRIPFCRDIECYNWQEVIDFTRAMNAYPLVHYDNAVQATAIWFQNLRSLRLSVCSNQFIIFRSTNICEELLSSCQRLMSTEELLKTALPGSFLYETTLMHYRCNLNI